MPNQTATNPTEALWNLLDHVAQGRVRLEDVLRKFLRCTPHAGRRIASLCHRAGALTNR